MEIRGREATRTKIHFGPELRAKTLSNILVVTCGILLTALIFRFGAFQEYVGFLMGIILPFTIGAVTAFLMAPPVNNLERLLIIWLCRHKNRLKLCRTLSILICYVMLFALIVGFFAVIVPQLISSVQTLSAAVTSYLRLHGADITNFLDDYNITGTATNAEKVLITWEEVTARTFGYAGKVLGGILSMSATISNGVVKTFLGLVISIYLLFDKERFAAQAKKLAFSALNRGRVETLLHWSRTGYSIFSKFMTGKVLESALVGLICYLGMILFHMEFPVLISVIVGITDFVPIFGPVIGGAIGVLVLLITDPMDAFWFLIFMIVLQQIDGNIIGPHILGDYVGLSPFWTMLAIIIGGGLFGFAGMLISIPVFALLYAISRAAIGAKLRAKGLPDETNAYMDDAMH